MKTRLLFFTQVLGAGLFVCLPGCSQPSSNNVSRDATASIESSSSRPSTGESPQTQGEPSEPKEFKTTLVTGYLSLEGPVATKDPAASGREAERTSGQSGEEANGTPPNEPTHLRVNDVSTPVGIDATPFFGWWVNDADANEIQSAYQILVASSLDRLSRDEDDLWDSGEVESGLQNHVRYEGAPLQSEHQYFWKVRTWDRHRQQGVWSEPGRFTVGLLENSDWSGANWIKRDTDEADDYTYYRKTMELPAGNIERATVYVSSVHKYALYANGKLVGKGPAYHHPQYQYYNAFDVTTLLRAGEPNQLAILNHWFGGGQGRPKSNRGVIMKAIVHFANGDRVELGTDGTWRQAAGPWILHPDSSRNRGEGVGYVEEIDARKYDPNWNTLDFDDSSWAAATVIGAHPTDPWTGQLSPDLTRIRERAIKPAKITQQDDHTVLVDFGKVYAGIPRIQFSGGNSGDRVDMLGGYVLKDDGSIDKDGNQSTDLRFFATLDGEEFLYEPIEYVGMRYLQIRNAPMPITKDNVALVARYSDMDDKASSFESSDDTLDAVWEFMKHSLFTCAQEEFVDTPTREKGGFLGDAAIQSTVAMLVTNERLLTQRVLQEFLQSMDHHWSDSITSGRMNAVYPNNDGGRDIPDFTQSYPVWVWNYYLTTGDRDFLESNYEKLKQIGEYVNRHRDTDTRMITNLDGGTGKYIHGIIDWPETMRFGYQMGNKMTVTNGWAYADYVVLSKIAKLMGRDEDRELFQRRADSLRNAMNSQLINADGVYVDGLSSKGDQRTHASQHANMFPMALGFVPDEVHSSVIGTIKEQQMSVGMVTLPWLVRAIGQADEGEHLVELFTNKDWRGWAQCLSRGATATWESWDADTTKQSRSHAWGAAGLEGYVRYILGIRPLKPQYEHVLIQPLDFGSRLSFAKGSIRTDRGDLSVHWKRKSDVYGVQVSIPTNVVADIALPVEVTEQWQITLDGKPSDVNVGTKYIVVHNVGSGQHTLVAKNKE